MKCFPVPVGGVGTGVLDSVLRGVGCQPAYRHHRHCRQVPAVADDAQAGTAYNTTSTSRHRMHACPTR